MSRHAERLMMVASPEVDEVPPTPRPMAVRIPEPRM
jgi:hypothetical protein